MKRSNIINLIKIASLIGGLTFLIALIIEEENARIKPAMMQDRVLFLRDSLEMEYYRKELEATYPVDHSKIP